MKLDISTKENFSESYHKIDMKRRNVLEETSDTQVKKDLYSDGISVANAVFTEDDLSEMIHFQNSIEKILGKDMDCGGYVNLSLGANQMSARLNKVLPNHGQIRVQTKGMPFEMPGFKRLTNHPLLKDIFSWWHQDEGAITRGTMEWIIPSDINHNGWHKDVVRPQLKAFVLLGDVDIDTAPMYYAKKSHLMSNDFEKEVAHRLFKESSTKISDYLPRRGKHYVGIMGGHSGFLSDDEAKNDPIELNDSPVVLGGSVYEKKVCTGKLGDVIFFEASGFHSGNISHGKIRRTISLSSPSNRTDLSLAFDEQGAKTV